MARRNVLSGLAPSGVDPSVSLANMLLGQPASPQINPPQGNFGIPENILAQYAKPVKPPTQKSAQDIELENSRIALNKKKLQDYSNKLTQAQQLLVKNFQGKEGDYRKVLDNKLATKVEADKAAKDLHDALSVMMSTVGYTVNQEQFSEDPSGALNRALEYFAYKTNPITGEPTRKTGETTKVTPKTGGGGKVKLTPEQAIAQVRKEHPNSTKGYSDEQIMTSTNYKVIIGEQ